MRFKPVLASLLAAFIALPCSAFAVSQADAVPAPAPAVEPAAAPVVTPLSTSPNLNRVDLEAWLDGFMPYAIGRGDIPGAIVVVVKDGQPLLEKGYGYADVAEHKTVDPATTLFRPGSVSKLFTWTAVMQLVEEGKVDLDADIDAYLDFKIPPRDGKPITLRNIMTHTSGIEETARGLITSNPKDAIELGDYVKHWVPTRIFAPGVTPSYSNYATTLAGYIVQRVSGQPFDDYIEQHIFAPLGMQHSSFRQPLPPALQPLMSKGYKPGVVEPQGFEIVNPAPAGSLSASGADMGRFMIAHLQNGEYAGQRILKESTAVQMHTSGLDILPPLNRMVLGFYEDNINGHRVIAHAGDTQWFHSDLYLFLDDGVGLFVSFNSPGKEGVAGKIRGDLFKQFADRYLPGPISEGTVDVATAKLHAQQMLGVYENSRRSNDTFTSLANLAGQTKVVLTKDGSISLPSLTDLGGQAIKWREIAPYVWRDINSGNRLAAKVVDGKVQRFGVEPISPFMLFDRVPWWKSSAWLVPAFIVALLALALTVLAWPVSALVRRHYKAPYRLSGMDRKAHRTVRFAALVTLVTIFAAMIFLSMLLSNFDRLNAGNDWIVSLLRIAALIVFPIATLVAAWSTWVTIRSNRRWTAKLWSIVLFLSCLTVLWVSYAFGLAGFTANY
ncbi:MAG: serine hydrolase domain-containing protein [Dokdonella sp.]